MAAITDQAVHWVEITVPAAFAAGPAEIVVQSASEGETVYAAAYNYNPSGIIHDVSPDTMPAAGGQAVVISGANLSDGTLADVSEVTLCGVAATVVDVSGTTQLVVTAGASGVWGLGDVHVFSTSRGQTVADNAFTYTDVVFGLLGKDGVAVTSGAAASVASGTDFGSVVRGSALTNIFSITNSGNAALNITDFEFSDLGFEVSGMPGTVDVGAVSNFTVTFAPLSAGAFPAVLQMANNSQTTPYIVNLAGEGLKQDQTIKFDQIPGQNVTNILKLSASASSGLPVTFQITDGPAVLTGVSVSFTGTGVVSIAASQAGDADWAAAPEVTRSFEVTGGEIPPPPPPPPHRPAVLNDYSGDGQADLVIYHQPTGVWYIRGRQGNLIVNGVRFGGPGFVPVPGDYTGDMKNDLAVYEQATGKWHIRTVAGVDILTGAQWGGPGFVPVPGDYTGDGIYDLAVYEQATGKWFIRSADEFEISNLIFEMPVARPSSGKTGVAPTAQWGGPDMIPVPGDFTGDGKSDFAVYHTETGNWYIRGANEPISEISNMISEMPISRPNSGKTGVAPTAQWGGPGFIPVSGDFNNDGKSDFAVYEQATGKWYVRANDASIVAGGEQWGGPEFHAVAGDFTGNGRSDLAVYHPETGNWYIRTLDDIPVVYEEQWGGPEYAPGNEPVVSVKPEGLSAVYRFFGVCEIEPVYEHMFTMGVDEAVTLDDSPVWLFETVAWQALGTRTGDAVALYRLYNATARTHYWTTDINLYNTLISHGWIGEGVSMYVWATTSGRRMPVYKFYNADIDKYLFTADLNEKRVLIADPGYGYAYYGIAFYVY